MCGIVGYLGKSTKAKTLINILKKLEYRGYDSSGIASLKDGKITTFKQVGNIQKLDSSVPDEFETSCLVAHTRWATHGKPTEVNAHPHSSCDGVWTLVHNGIIENFDKLKNKLKNKPQSQTDTVVVSCLLEEQGVEDIFGFINAFKQVKGSYAIVAENKNKPNELFLAKHKSPLYLSVNNDGDILVASDPICFVGFSKKYYTFADGEFAHITKDELKFFDENGNDIKKQTKELDDTFEESDKKEYKHFMLKEIFEQPKALERQIKTFKDNDVLNKFDKDFISRFSNIKLIGCGTAYHAGLVGAKYLSRMTGLPAYAEMASEFIYNQPVFADEKTLFIFVSQSGETADTLCAQELAKGKGATTIALTNVLYSTLASKCDYVIPVCAGPEIAVASTKAYVCQLSALYMFALNLKCQVENIEFDGFEKIETVANKILNFDMAKVEELASELKTKNEAIFIGKDFDYITANEASLKLKEVAYINSASYPSGELKHGFLALVENGTPIIVFAGGSATNSKTFNAAHEAASRGANAFVVTNQSTDIFENVLLIDEPDDLLFPMLSIAPLQYLAYIVSTSKGINPDQPRNLAKSVTVE